MLPKEVNELLTQVGPGAPMGDLLRRYWQPVALAEELPTGGPPLPVQLLGEELVLYRDEQGRPGLLGRYCAHRGADLSYGRVEDGGLRCIYHGWLYDKRGHCLDQPSEPPGKRFNEGIQLHAYPCLELGDAVFAYLGPGEPPLVPGFDFLQAAPGHVVAHKLFSECSFLQGNEGNLDSTHVSFLHRRMTDTGPGYSEHTWFDTVVTDETSYGIHNYWLRELADSTAIHTSIFLMPVMAAIAGVGNGAGYSVNWHVPIDDTHHWKYTFQYRSGEMIDRDKARAGRTPNLPDYRPVPHKANRYMQDRSLMQDVVFSGVPQQFFQAQDLCATEGRPIQDRTHEHLGYGDRAIIAARTLLLRAIKDLQEGRDPPGVVRAGSPNRFPLVVKYGSVPAGADWRMLFEESEAAIR